MHLGGIYLNIEGPTFSTRAESKLYRSWGMDVIGMTNLIEARLAREAEMCFSTLALVTDYDSWNEEEKAEDVTVEMVLENLKLNAETAQKIITAALPNIPEVRTCKCRDALKTAIVTPLHLVPELTIDKLNPILGKYNRK